MYLNALLLFDCIIGNSSSGINEASLLRKSVINIGNRQKGRYKFGKVIDVKSDYKSTPLEGVIPGSYIYTNAISSILNQDLLVEWSITGYVFYLTILIVALIAAGAFLNGKQFSLISVSIIIFHRYCGLIAKFFYILY